MPDAEDTQPLQRLDAAVQAFLEYQERVGSESPEEFLSRHEDLRDLLLPMLANDEPVPADETALGQLGGYRLVREVGRGGMGVVYEAIEESLDRRVALKVLPPMATLQPRQIERFRREAAAAARIQHPGVVPVYGVGESGGTYYFAMEFVDGPTLGTRVARLRERFTDFRDGFGDAELGKGLGSGYQAQVATLVARVGDALAAAHEQGVIHRDIKPQNLLLTSDDAVRVVDFGLAKDLARHSISQAEEVGGTPHYMSPEQVGGLRNVDHRTDIYSLGVVLYELLSLRCPFERSTQQALLLAITTQEPPPLRRVSPRVAADLDVICQRALEKDPARRYQTAAEFAADLRRFVDHEPIHARPPSSVTRFLKLVRRRRAASIAVATVALVPLLGLVFYFQVHRPRLQREQARVDLEQRMNDQSVVQAQEAIRVHVMRAIDLAQKPHMESTCRDMIVEAIGMSRRLQDRADRVPGVVPFLAGLHGQLGRTLVELGDPREALQHLERCVALFGEALARVPGSRRLQRELLVGQTATADVLDRVGRAADAEALLTRTIAGQQKLAPSTPGSDEDHEGDCLTSRVVLGRLLTREGRFVEAERVFGACLAELERGTQEWRTKHAADHFEVHYGVGRLSQFRGLGSAAVEQFERAIAVGKVALTRGPQDRIWRERVARADRDLGASLDLLGRAQESAAAFDRAFDAFDKLRGEFPGLVGFTLGAARSLAGRASIEGRARRWDAAERAAREAVRLVETIPEDQSAVANYIAARGKMRSTLAQVLSNLTDRVAETDKLFDAAIADQRAAVRQDPKLARAHSVLALTLHNRGSWLFARKRFAPAKELAQEALAEQRAALALLPENKYYLRHCLLHQRLLAESCLYTRNYVAAEQATRDYLATGGTKVATGQAAIVVARNFARCASLAEIDGLLTEDARKSVMTRCATDAIRYLKVAVDAGCDKRRLRDPAFSVLRGRQDFRALLR
ncbi:MAG: serine/threonine protein kinase [Planctomycetes bacterium]|nr:serine/threonine protein kinase [Planctomycetota bacterium]